MQREYELVDVDDGAWECPACGVLVEDTQQHDLWHDGDDIVVSDVERLKAELKSLTEELDDLKFVVEGETS